MTKVISLKSYQHCINNTLANLDPASPKKTSLCGRDITMNWHFIDVLHWFQNRQNEGRLMGCPECLRVVKKIVDEESIGE